MYRILILFTLLTIGLSSFGQNVQEPENYCGTVELSAEQQEFLDYFHSHESEFTGLQQAEAVKYIPVKVHSVGDDNGEGHMASADILRVICELNDWYQLVNFYFYLYEDIDIINNSGYYNHSSAITGSLMMNQNNVADVLNMYFVNDPAGNCGYFSPGGDAVAIKKSCAGASNTTVPHEVGHYFSLPHTFHGWEGGTPPANQREFVDGSNCNNVGDGFCDTPADYLADRWHCPYSGPVLLDPHGDTVIPDGSYIMSYANDACTYQFSPQQRSAMRAYQVSKRNSLTNHTLPSFIVDGPSELVFPTDQMGGVPPNSTTFTWKAVDGASQYLLQISRVPIVVNNEIDVLVQDTSFQVSGLSSNKKYFWKVSTIANGNVCLDNTTTIQSFTTGWPTGIEDQQLSDLRIYPNPLGKGQNLTIAFGKPLTNGLVELTNLQGQAIAQYAADGSLLQVPTANVPAGIYLIRIHSEEGSRTERIVLQ